MSANQTSYIQLQRKKEIMSELCEKSKPTPVAKVAPEVKQTSECTGITKTCAVMGCEDSKNLSSDQFFRFPEEPNLRQVWADLTGRNNWTPTDFSYVCIQHFSVDCFECDSADNMVLVDKSVPSLKLPKHVLEVEYIEEDSLGSDEEMTTDHANGDIQTNGDIHKEDSVWKSEPRQPENQFETIKLFEDVKRIQLKAAKLKNEHRRNMRIYNRQNSKLRRLRELIEIKKKVVEDKRAARTRLLLSIEDKIKDDQNGLVMAMPVRHTEDMKNFSLNIYKYSPQAYIYMRNMLRTALPSTDTLETWLQSGFQPRDIFGQSSFVKMGIEQSEKELVCRISLC